VTSLPETPCLSLEDFARLFQTGPGDFPEDCLAIIAERDFRFRRLGQSERDDILRKIIQRIFSGDLWKSGPGKVGIWERGWSENLEAYILSGDVGALTPRFVQRERVLRMDGDYAEPVSPSFEFDVVDVLRRWAFTTYFSEVRSVFEFGCGSCQHLPVLAEKLPGRTIHGLDWAEATQDIIRALRETQNLDLQGHLFNLFEPDAALPLDSGSGVLTVGTMEQLGTQFEPFLQFLLTKAPSVVVHFETVTELYDDQCLVDHLALCYDRGRNYLNGYLARLQALEAEGRIRILRAHRTGFGSLYHDGYSMVVWQPR
jgi:hypothetical protein